MTASEAADEPLRLVLRRRRRADENDTGREPT
jgi:hypothetical protein